MAVRKTVKRKKIAARTKPRPKPKKKRARRVLPPSIPGWRPYFYQDNEHEAFSPCNNLNTRTLHLCTLPRWHIGQHVALRLEGEVYVVDRYNDETEELISGSGFGVHQCQPWGEDTPPPLSPGPAPRRTARKR